MRVLTTILALTILSACAIKDNRSDYEYPADSDVSGPDWPELAVTAELEEAGKSTTQTAAENQNATERLAARARALRARADRLRRQVNN